MSNLTVLKNRRNSIEVILRASIAMSAVANVRIRRVSSYIEKAEKFFSGFEAFASQIRESIYLPFIMNKEKGHKLNILIGCDKGLCGNFYSSVKSYFKIKSKKDDDIWMLLGQKTSSLANKNRFVFFGDLNLDIEAIFAKTFEIWSFIKSEFIQELDIHYYSKTGITKKTVFSVDLIKKDLQNNIKVESDLFGHIDEKEKFEKEDLEEAAVFLLGKEIFSAVLESSLQENKKRSISMEKAKNNARTMCEEMKILYNKLRQEKVTNDLSEIMTFDSEGDF